MKLMITWLDHCGYKSEVIDIFQLSLLHIPILRQFNFIKLNMFTSHVFFDSHLKACRFPFKKFLKILCFPILIACRMIIQVLT